ncbi:hypothetical protein [Tsukamurella tyrosinosolvens]|uniref:hypothetical protein n=1 Tax=Tsukamurella tyrosinosolvens TaxID=57704 RepID=UPI0034635789
MTDEEVERLAETGRALTLRLLACAATVSAADVARTGNLVTPDDVRAIHPAAGELWATALKVAADGATPPTETELQAALVRDGKYVDDHGAVLQAAMLALSTTTGHPPMFRTAAADVLGLVYRLRLQSSADALADAAGRFSEADSFELLLREGTQIRDLYDRLRTLRGEP